MTARLTLCLIVCGLFSAGEAVADPGSIEASIDGARELLYAGDLERALAELVETERALGTLTPCPIDAWQELYTLRAGVLLKQGQRDDATAAARAALGVTGTIDVEQPRYWPSLRALLRAQRDVEIAPPPSCLLDSAVAAPPIAAPSVPVDQLAAPVVVADDDALRPAPTHRRRALGVRVSAGLAVAGSKMSQGSGPNSTGAMIDSSMSGPGSGAALTLGLGRSGVVAELRGQWLDLASAEAHPPTGTIRVEAGWMAVSSLEVGYQIPLPGRLALEAGVTGTATHWSPGDSARVMAVTSSTRGTLGPHGALRWSIGERVRLRASGGMALVSRWLDAPDQNGMTPLPPEMYWLGGAIDVRITGAWFAAANVDYSVSEWTLVGTDAATTPPGWMIDEAQSLALTIGRVL